MTGLEARAGADPAQRAVPGGYVETAETHSAVLFFVGDRAYKLKKPVDLGFLDFSTRERREAACRRELELNRRLAPDVYLGTGEVTDVDGAPLEHLLVMRRLPGSRRLAWLVAAGQDVRAEIRELARLVAAFHSRAERSPEISEQGTPAAVAGRWKANLREAAPYVGGLLPSAGYDEVRRLSMRYLAGRATLLHERIRRGAVVDGHGDLLADDIFCLDDGPRVLDCLDFDDRLRHVDRIDDVACLAMDLERLGSPRLAAAFLDDYLKFSGDHVPASLVHHYVAYRAFMRAKVTCLPHGQDRPEVALAARTLLTIAHRHLDAARVQLLLVGGPPGTGKSTLAAALADAVGCTVISSDRVRKELAGLPAEVHAGAPLHEGIYSSEWTWRTYEEMARRAARLLVMGETVVLDATWARPEHRRLAAAIAAATSSDLLELCCRLPEETVAERVAARDSISDADPATADRLRREFVAWPRARLVDTRRPVADLVADLVPCVRPVWSAASLPPAGAG